MTRVMISSVLLLLAVTAASAQVEIAGTTTALMYLERFGYMDPSATNPQSGALLSQEAVRQAIIDFQSFAGIDQTGTLNNETVEYMNMKRCGNRDIIGHGANTRKKRYALQGSRWKVRDLTYKITKYPKGLKRTDVDYEIERAFQVWADVSSLSFKAATSGKIHIDIRFETGEHGDGDPFDGPGGTLAHAYFPIYGGDAHFDDTETWTIDSYKGTNLFQVAAHEFGHSLGLSHSDVRSALMAPFYRGYESIFKLDNDDIKAIQSLYGKKETTATTPRPIRPTTKRPPADESSALCLDSTIDAVVTMMDKETYVFKGSQYYKLTEDSVAPGYPRSIRTNWGGMPGFLDAAFTWSNGKTYFFKGNKYWRFSNLTMDKDYPKLISKGFAGIPDDIDAAFVWSGNGKIYFTKGSQYWRFDPTKRPPVKETYPYDMSNWEGIPSNLDDALQYSNGYTYFFKDGQYYRFNDRTFKVDSADPPFPRPVGYWWFGCRSSSSQRVAPSGRDDLTAPDDYDVGDDSFDADGSQDNRLGFSFRQDSYNPRPDVRDQVYHQTHHQAQQSEHQSHQQMDSGAVQSSSSFAKMLTALLVPVVVSFL